MIYDFLNFKFDTENIKCIYPNDEIAAIYEPQSESGIRDKYYLPTLLKHLDFCMITDVYPVFSLTANRKNPYYEISLVRLKKFAKNRTVQDKVLSIMMAGLYMDWLLKPTTEKFILLRDCMKYAQPIMYEKTNSGLPFDDSLFEQSASYNPTMTFSQVKFLNCSIDGAITYKGRSVMFFEETSLYHNFSILHHGERRRYEIDRTNDFSSLPASEEFRVLIKRMDFIKSTYKPITLFEQKIYNIDDIFSKPLWESEFYTSTPFNAKLEIPLSVTDYVSNNRPLTFHNATLHRILSTHFYTMWTNTYYKITSEFTLFQNNNGNNMKETFSSFNYSMLRKKTFLQFPMMMVFFFMECRCDNKQEQYFEIMEDKKHKIKTEKVVIKYDQLYYMPFGVNFKITGNQGPYRLVLNHAVYSNSFLDKNWNNMNANIHLWGVRHFQLKPFLNFSFDSIKEVELYDQLNLCPQTVYIKHQVNILMRFYKNNPRSCLFMTTLNFLINDGYFYFVVQNNNKISTPEKVLFLTVIRMYQSFNTRVLGGTSKTIIIDNDEYRKRIEKNLQILQRRDNTVDRFILARETEQRPSIKYDIQFQDEDGPNENGAYYFNLSNSEIAKNLNQCIYSSCRGRRVPKDYIQKYLAVHVDDYSDEAAAAEAAQEALAAAEAAVAALAAAQEALAAAKAAAQEAPAAQEALAAQEVLAAAEAAVEAAEAAANGTSETVKKIPDFYIKHPELDDIDPNIIAAAANFPDFPVEYFTSTKNVVKIHSSCAKNFILPVFYFQTK